jgi:hypothetical protein
MDNGVEQIGERLAALEGRVRRLRAALAALGLIAASALAGP